MFNFCKDMENTSIESVSEGNKGTKAAFGSCKSISGKYLFSGNAIFQKRKCFHVFCCISENIF